MSMKWHNPNEYPEKWKNIVVLCENNNIYFNAEFDGDEFTIWDAENGFWNKIDTVLAWMMQDEIEEFLLRLNETGHQQIQGTVPCPNPTEESEYDFSEPKNVVAKINYAKIKEL